MSKYDTYKPSGIDWIGEIPKDWNIKRLKEIANVETGNTPSTSNPDFYSDEGIPWIKPDNLNDFIELTDSAEKLSENGVKEARVVRKGAVLVCCIGTIGKIGIAGCDLATNQQINSVEFYNKRILDNYGKYLLYISEPELVKQSNKVVVSILNKIKQSQIKFPIPSIDEQLAIANYLDDQTQKIDRLIANKKAQAEKLKELRQIEINNAVTKGLNPNAEMKDSGIEWLGKIPKHWEVKKIKQLLKPEKNAIKTGPFGSDLKFEDLIEEGIKVYNQRSVLDNDWKSGEGYISAEKYESLRTCTIFPDDIVITTRGTIGKVSIFPSDAELGILHPCLMRIQMNSQRILNDYLKIIINDSSFFFEALKLASNATTIDVIYSDSLKEVKIPVPPTNEQIEITTYLQKRVSAIDQLIKNIEAQIEKLQELRKIKIYEAVTGKICLNQDFQDAQMNRIKTESL